MTLDIGGCGGCGPARTPVIEKSGFQQSATCMGCGSSKMTAKLGACTECIFSNIMASIFCWLVFFGFLLFHPAGNAVFTSLGFACFFTFLLAAHGLAFVVRKATAVSVHDRGAISGKDPAAGAV